MKVNYASVVVAAGAFVPQGVTALGHARVVNKCSYAVFASSVGTNVSGPTKIDAGQVYGERFVLDRNSGGKAIKITKTADGLQHGEPQTILAYTLAGDTVFYDLSDVFGDGFAGSKLEVTGNAPGCRPIVWEDGTPPAGSQVKSCTSEADVILTLCA
ncbi:hypothetical protein CDD80_6766 [Ophiocordyceps camponoti-rufipedis]|uniref:Bys1 family protein n=1 Tax=Ophiocordyceps camponoti-rufipedis TaxID=2004952 RepID=A0A2C5YK91_9HYPO|nr:hypothetical protein CDD80_6766 [Ophiocordyceps camponoti-rufipedis]